MIIIKVLIIEIIFKITTTTTTTIIIITYRCSKLIRSSYKYCFPHCPFSQKNAF